MEKEMLINPNSERAIISACMQDEKYIVKLEEENITADYFGIEANRYIVITMFYLYQKSIKPTPLAIKEVLTDNKSKEALEEMGGLEYLQTLSTAPINDSIPIFIDKLKQAHMRRLIVEACNTTVNNMLSDSAEKLNPTELLGVLNEKINNIEVYTSTKEEVYQMGSNTLEVLEKRKENPNAVPGLMVGWAEYDNITNGALPGDLIIVVAESKTGKSTLLTNWATNIAVVQQKPVLYIDTEMSSREQEDRIIARLSKIPHKEIVSGMYVLDTPYGKGKEKVKRVSEAVKVLQSSKFFHIYMPHFDINKINAITKQYKIKYGIEALFFDYLKVPSSGTGTLNKSMQEYQALGFFASGLKDLAGTLEIPVFSAAQANRSDYGNAEKDARHIGGSYRILQLASKLMFLSNKDENTIAVEGEQNGNQVLSIKYQRNGSSDTEPINIKFWKEMCWQEEV
jgi:replicative DNA helicase